MTLPHILILLSLTTNFCATLVYMRDTVRGTTKPNRATWFLWALAPLVASFIAFRAGADPWITAVTFESGFLPLIVFLLSFTNREGYWKLTSFDWSCAAFSLLAFVFWLMTSAAGFSIILAIVSDFLASVPTLKKLWQHPETETKILFVFTFVSFLLSGLAIRGWSIENSAFQIYLLVMNFALLVAAYKKDVSRLL